MNSLVRSAANSENALSRASIRFAPAYGRCPAAYARLVSQLAQKPARNAASLERATLPATLSTPLRSSFFPAELRIPSAASQSRFLHVSGRRLQEEKPKTEAKPAEDKAAEKAEPKATSEEDPAKDSEEKAEGKEEGKAEGEEGKEKKEDLPPPPPHGDKTPWQVFMETMNTELKKSQEWNESTKQIAASANQFTESESVRRAREAYEKSTSAISSTTTKAVKSTATVIGKGAAWTWDTSAMKGVRKAANVTGDALDKATKPIRETEAFKNVKDVIDDGSSSRYGGWVEKEERRKRREQLEKERGEDEVFQEDPK
jgi:import inner membrane translocase subunit TIM44